jgi:hypothetical protein
MKSLVLSSVESVAQVVSNNPALKKVPFFSNLKPYLDALNSPGCCAKNNLMQQYRKSFENAIIGLDENSARQIKQTMGVEQICWYVKNAKGQLEKRCK